MLVSCTFLPVYRTSSIYLLMRVNILLYNFFCFVLMHCSQPCYSLYCSSSCTLPHNLSFKFLCCDCFYLYIDGFYIWYVLLYLKVSVSVLFRLNSLLPSAMCIYVYASFPVFAAIHHFKACHAWPNHYHRIITCYHAEI